MMLVHGRKLEETADYKAPGHNTTRLPELQVLVSEQDQPRFRTRRMHEPSSLRWTTVCTLSTVMT